MKFSAKEISQIVGGECFGEDIELRTIVCDSRSSTSGEGVLFVAMRGRNNDSHEYIEQMAQRGVRAFMVEEGAKYTTLDGCTYITVQHSINSLQALATHHRKTFKGKIIAITGSNGKTTIKEWLAQSLPQNLKVFRSPRSYNSQLGVALSLLMIEGDEDIAIIEAGISKPSEMTRLERMIRPEIVVLSSIGEAHAEGFENEEHKIKEKLLLAANCELLIYNSAYEQLLPHVLYIGIKTLDAATFSADDIQGTLADKRNFQIVAALHHSLGLNAPDKNSLYPLAMRLEVVEGLSGSIIINDSYNSDINSLSIALDALRQISAGREMTLILSNIPQSGTPTGQLHARLSQIIRHAGIEQVIGVGEEISSLQKQLESLNIRFKHFASTEDLIAKISDKDYHGRAILLKGSRKNRFERVAHMLSKQSHTTTLEVDLEAMRENLEYYKSLTSPTVKMMAMVKARSYGAGDIEVAQMLEQWGVDYLAVAFADEGCTLREKGINMPIIVLNADDGSFSQMIDFSLEPEIYSLRSLKSFAACLLKRGERNYPIHLKIDSGMHRLGFMEGEIEELIREIKAYGDLLKVTSVFSHLSSADVCAERSEKQIEDFERMSSEIIKALDYPIMRHIAASAAIPRYKNAHFDMCRLGIGLYGFGEKGLKPVSKLLTRIVQIREIEAGEAVSYGASQVVERKTKVATIPIGYADGLSRRLGGGEWSMLVNDTPCPTLGRICMDSTMIDVSDIEGVEEGAQVTIFSATEGNTVADMAHTLGTITYEVLSSISSRVKRIYIR